MKEFNKPFINRLMNYDLTFIFVLLVLYIFISNAFSSDKNTETFLHLGFIVITALYMINLDRIQLKGSDELEKRISEEVIVKTYSIVMPLMFCFGYGILKFLKLHEEAKIVGITFAIILAVRMIVQFFINKKYK